MEQEDLNRKLIQVEGLISGDKKSKKVQEEIEFLKEELHDIQCEIDAPPLHGQIKPARPGKGGGKVERYVSPVEMADAAFAAFITACVDLNNANIDGCCVPFINHPRCVARFGKGFTIRMGFGMHVGWCVQGAIGSKFKIDCTLSVLCSFVVDFILRFCLTFLLYCVCTSCVHIMCVHHVCTLCVFYDLNVG